MKVISLFFLITSYSVFSQQRYELSQKESIIFWKSTNAAGFGGHEGTLLLKSGELWNDVKGKLSGGSFVIDMNSITNTDIKQEKSQKELEEHLKSADFFDVVKFPLAVFKIVKIEATNNENKYSVLGDFTLKGITNRIVFTAYINQENSNMKAKAGLTIYRSQWGITYKTKGLWDLNNLKNDYISEEIPIQLNLVFRKI